MNTPAQQSSHEKHNNNTSYSTVAMYASFWSSYSIYAHMPMSQGFLLLTTINHAGAQV